MEYRCDCEESVKQKRKLKTYTHCITSIFTLKIQNKIISKKTTQKQSTQ